MNFLCHTLALSLLASTAANAETVVVTAAHMVDVAAGKTIDNAAVVVVDGRITAAGAASRVAIPAGPSASISAR